MIARREFLRAGGTTLAGLAAIPLFDARRTPAPVDIHMRSDTMGARVWFDPIGIAIAPGQTVRWINTGNVHTATAYHPANGGRPLRIPGASAPWDSGYLINPGDAFEIVLDVEGVYDYLCIPHEIAGMVGRIVVGDPAKAPALPPGDSVPAAARQAFPPVDLIVRAGRVSLDDRESER